MPTRVVVYLETARTLSKAFGGLRTANTEWGSSKPIREEHA
jgi:hypothetical protein